MIMVLLYHTRFKIPLVFDGLDILFFKNLVFFEKGMPMPNKIILCLQ